MDGKFYGWIGRTKKHIKQSRNNGTTTAKYIKYYLRELGAEPANITGVQTKNLYEMDGKYYYRQHRIYPNLRIAIKNPSAKEQRDRSMFNYQPQGAPNQTDRDFLSARYRFANANMI